MALVFSLLPVTLFFTVACFKVSLVQLSSPSCLYVEFKMPHGRSEEMERNAGFGILSITSDCFVVLIYQFSSESNLRD